MSKKIKIGIILPALPSYSETFFYNKIKVLLKNGYSVSLFVNNLQVSNYQITLPVYPQAKVNNYYKMPLILLKLLFSSPIRLLRFIYLEFKANISLINALKHLIINSHIIDKNLDWLHFGFATMAINRENLSQAMGCKSAVSLRGYDIGLFPYKNSGCYKLLWKKIDKVHVISSDLYDLALKDGLSRTTPVKKITPAIDIKKFQFVEKDINKNPFKLLSVGRLTWKKGYEYALRALKHLEKEGYDFSYQIIGSGKYYEAIKFLIHQLGLSSKVQLIGQVNHKEVIEKMKTSDIYIQPSIQEGFCNSVIEAQAMGLICIVTNAEGLSENIIDNYTGIVIPKRSSKEIVEAIKKVLSMDKRKVIEKRRNARNRVENLFCLEKHQESFKNFYQ